MLLAARIDDARKAKGWSQHEFAEQMGKNPSEISKWLSGTHNFTSDTLWDIEEKLLNNFN
jgi:transcriptional regulator with XRE-family HTH domain